MYIETIRLTRKGDGFKTGLGVKGKDNSENWKLFRAAKPFDVGIDRADFIVDLCRDDGQIVRTVCVRASAISKLIGRKAPTVKEARQYDRDYWNGARAARAAA